MAPTMGKPSLARRASTGSVGVELSGISRHGSFRAKRGGIGRRGSFSRRGSLSRVGSFFQKSVMPRWVREWITRADGGYGDVGGRVLVLGDGSGAW